MKHLIWKERARKTIYENQIFKLTLSDRTADDGREGTFTLVECHDWVTVVAISRTAPDAKYPQGRPALVMVRQYRVGNQRVGLEFPGGIMELGENPLLAAKRELREETGYVAAKWIKLGEVNPNPSFMTNTTHSYLALDLLQQHDQSLDKNEIIDIEVVAVAELENGHHDDFEINGIMLINWFWFKRWRELNPALSAKLLAE